MNIERGLIERLHFLIRLVAKETLHLENTDRRLFEQAFTVERVAQLNSNPDLAERVEAFISRFGRLQDTLGDKLLPNLLQALGESTAPLIDNLDTAEKFQLITSADDWLAMRRLRNQMVHEYIEDPVILASALQSGHSFVPTLICTAEKMSDEILTRWPSRDLT